MGYSSEREKVRTEERRKAREAARFERAIVDLHKNTKSRAAVKGIEFRVVSQFGF